MLLARCRGTFGSGGVFEPMVHEVDDGADTVAWMREQPWFEGRFATFGGSYLGFTQWALLMDPPPELATAIISIGPHDFRDAAYQQGAFNLNDFLGWSYQTSRQEDAGFVGGLAAPGGWSARRQAGRPGAAPRRRGRAPAAGTSAVVPRVGQSARSRRPAVVAGDARRPRWSGSRCRCSSRPAGRTCSSRRRSSSTPASPGAASTSRSPSARGTTSRSSRRAAASSSASRWTGSTSISAGRASGRGPLR